MKKRSIIFAFAVYIIMLAALLSSCGTASLLSKLDTEPSRKEVRRTNKAAKALKKVLTKYPDLANWDSVITPVSIRTPEISRTIVQPLMVPVENTLYLPGAPVYIPADLQPFSQIFEDSSLVAQVSFDGKNFTLDYTIKEMLVDTGVPTPQLNIQATEFVPMPLTWWQKLWVGSGKIAWIILLILLILTIIRGWFKRFLP